MEAYLNMGTFFRDTWYNWKKKSRFVFNNAKTERYKKSTKPSLQWLLNKVERKFKNIL